MAKDETYPELFVVFRRGNTSQSKKIDSEELASILSKHIDFHNSVYDISANEEYTIVSYKQMLVKDTLILNGTLNIDGQLFLEA